VSTRTWGVYHHRVSDRDAQDQQMVDRTFRRMYAEAVAAGLSRRLPHTITVTRTPDGRTYWMLWRTP
jgi:hypothetical protein